MIHPSVLNTLRCQQTLQPLDDHERGLYSEAADLVYPVRDGLVSMGYPEQDHGFMELTMEEERDWQTTNVERDLDFLKQSAPGAVQLVNLLNEVVPLAPSATSLELGAGSGWVSWLFAEAGFDTWICDFEANSLSLGWNFRHPHLGPGKRIVSDVTLLPFADATFDLVICKEIVHHVEDKRRLLAEANRVLKPGGVIVDDGAREKPVGGLSLLAPPRPSFEPRRRLD